MFEKLIEIEKKYKELTNLLTDLNIVSSPGKYKEIAKMHADLQRIIDKYHEYKELERRIEDAKSILKEEIEDQELKELAEIEMEEDIEKREELEKEIKMLLLPKDPNDEKNIFLEVRAGTGGEEAALFASEILRMYVRYAENRGWKTEFISSHPMGSGGFKEIIISIQGQSVYSHLKYEMGVHRVQRVPVTEASGRIHTSAVTVAVLPEAEEIDVEIDPEDIRIDVFRSSGHGGQSVNTTDSAVRITHIPTGIVVSCQDEKSQHKNKAKGLRVLRARLLRKFEEEQNEQIAQDRRNQVGSGDRSEKIRTYNFPQNRVTDHRIGLTLYKLNYVLDGNLDEIIDALITYYKTEELKRTA